MSFPGVSPNAGRIRPELQPLGRFQTDTGSAPDETTDFALTAGWGYFGSGSAVMPGGGKVNENETTIPAELQPLLGEKAYDIYLNDNACWPCVPEKVWHYTLGGYQVIKKWLSYRE